MSDKRLLQLDIAGILKKRIPASRQRFIPGFFYRMLARLIHQDELNRMLREGFPAEGSEFARKVLEYLDIEITVEGIENLPLPRERSVFASNHPLGGLDGIALISVLGNRYGDDNIRFLVNDLLMNVEPLSNVFLPVNKYGSQGRASAEAITKEYESDRQIIVFPAGLVSRLHPDGTIQDLDWQKAFAQKAIMHGRDIVPVRFVALNRSRFYRLADWRKRLGIRINLEQATLPAELCATRGSKFRIIIGKPLKHGETTAAGGDAKALAARIRDRVYTLLPPESL